MYVLSQVHTFYCKVTRLIVFLFVYWLKVLEGFEGLTHVHSLFVGKNKITKLDVSIMNCVFYFKFFIAEGKRFLIRVVCDCIHCYTL